MVYAAQPREGTETRTQELPDLQYTQLGLCSSTPRGDGNVPVDYLGASFRISLVYAAQPREGTETTFWHCEFKRVTFAVYAAQPREGTETWLVLSARKIPF